ncbi:hypothetical protein D9758_006012 [Tetrapyrgos nigripes]|uniref:Uncharacterized protein n=1 Tax=Tetrapyrgos nigripes TaxID=182062 RepID=A0A8H5FZU8_9AGAR|nr:hypothetical protein D9758_006012 [Tetrapyrgos nigripes]
MNTVPTTTSATQAKDRLYAQLASSFGRMNRSLNRTSQLCEQLQVDLHSMRIFAGYDAAKFMAVANSFNEQESEEEEEQPRHGHVNVKGREAQ